MQVTTELKPMFSYSIWFIIFILLFLIILFLINRKHPKKDIKEVVIIPNHKDLMAIKNNYLMMIQNLLNDINNGKISNRWAYQSLSSIIRNFIYEATNINVHKYTLEEIKTINIPILYELVSEYYDPEFSKISTGNIVASIDKTRTVILKWN